MIKRLFAILMIVVVCMCSFVVSAYADDEALSVEISTPLYDAEGNVTDYFSFGSVTLPHGVHHDLEYDSIIDASAVITYVNSWTHVNVSKNNRLDASYTYIIALINSCSTSTQSQISTSFEVETLKKFMYEKGQDPTDNYMWKSYLHGCAYLGAFLLYSPDYELYEPDKYFAFTDWFDNMNRQFLEEWFVYYNDALSDGNGYSWYMYTFNSETFYEFSAGQHGKPLLEPNTHIYLAPNLNFGGVYTTEEYNLVTVLMNLISMIQLPVMFAWLPQTMLSVAVTYLGMAMAVLMTLAVLKIVRG